MTYAEICDVVRKLKLKYDEIDPFCLCKDLNIILLERHLGNDPSSVKGFFLESKRIKTITVNSDLPLVVQKIIVAHELGHALLHCSNGIHAFHDVTMYDSINSFEKEANLFAAEYLLKDEDVLEALNKDSTFFKAASELMVPCELLDFKFRVLKWKGYKIMESPLSARNNFLKNMPLPDNDDDHIC